MKIKRLVILAAVFSVLLNLALVSVVGACEEPPPEVGTIIVHKFNDVNGNGVQDAGELDIQGWRIRIYYWQGWDPSPHVLEGFTGPDGTMTFSDLPFHPTVPKYWVWEEQDECWTPTTPYSGTWQDPYDGLLGYHVYVYLQTEYTTVDFGNTYTCPEFEGCTPGGWQGGHLSRRWDQAPDLDWNPPGENPFCHDTYFNDFFIPSWPSLDDLTMIDLVGTGGKKDHARKAARSLVAAYLNASHADVNYPADEGELMGMWADAVASGDFLELHKTLDGWNNLGCSVE